MPEAYTTGTAALIPTTPLEEGLRHLLLEEDEHLLVKESFNSTGKSKNECDDVVLEMEVAELFKALALRVITNATIGSNSDHSLSVNGQQYMQEVIDIIRRAGLPRYLSTWWDVIPTADVSCI